MSILISIVIPIFNAQQVIKRTIESIKSQMQNDIELILIDDGSSDNSYEICKKYETEINNIILRKEKNRGVSYARNYGKSLASGKYIWFVDADDYLSFDAIRVLKNVVQKKDYDMIVFNPVFEDLNGKIISFPIKNIKPGKIYNKKEIEEYVIPWMLGYVENQKKAFIHAKRVGAVLYADCYNAPWQALYKKDVINRIDFDSFLNIYEDFLFNMMVMLSIKSLYYVEKPLYHYISSSDGLATKYHANYVDMKLYLYKKILSILDTHGYKSEIKELLKYRICAEFMSIFINEINGGKNKMYNIRRFFADELISKSMIVKKNDQFSKKCLIWLVSHKMYFLATFVIEIRLKLRKQK